MCAEEHPFSWEEYIKKICMAYNSSIQSSTGYSPFYLMFGHKPRLPVDVMYNTGEAKRNIPEYITTLKKTLSNAYTKVQQNVSGKQEHQKELYDKRIHEDPHKPGDLVWLYNPAVPKGRVKKFHCPWTGPYQVLKKPSDATYKIKNVRSHKTKTIHFDRLKRCAENTRFLTPPNSTRATMHQMESANHSRPIGTELQVLDDDDDNLPHPPLLSTPKPLTP